MSVYQLAAIVQAFGGVFIREPFSGQVTVERADNVPPAILESLRERWGDLEAVLNEMSPPSPVDAAERILNAAFASLTA